MTMRLTAGVVSVGDLEDLDSYAVSLAEHPDGTGWALIISRAYEFTDEDIAQGMGTYAISTHEGRTHYGGIKGWQRNGVEFEVDVDEATVEDLGLEERFSLIVADDSTADTVEAGLQRVLA